MRQQRLIWTSVILTAAIISTAGFLNEGRVAAQAGQGTAPTPAIDPAVFSGLHWRSIGPNRGGRSQAVAGSDIRPFEYYFGATGGGLWKTTDGGQTWHAVSDKFFKTSSVGAVAVAPSNPDVVYVGMGETELRGNIIQGDGVYKSTDAAKRGRTWVSSATQTIARDARPPDESRRRVRRRARQSVRRESRARRFPIEGRRQDLGARPLSATRRPAPSISRWIRRTPTCSMPRCGKCSARRTRCRAAGRAAASSRAPTAAGTGPS